MRKKSISAIVFCILIVMANIYDSIVLRIALGLVSAVMIIDIVKEVRTWTVKREKSTQK